MKKIFLTLGALLVFGIASAQTDTTRTKMDRDRMDIKRERDKTDRTTKTPEELKDEAKDLKLDTDNRKDNTTAPPPPPPVPKNPPIDPPTRPLPTPGTPPEKP